MHIYFRAATRPAAASLLNHSFTGESTTLHAREKITYNVTTDGAPVNVLVLDSKAFEQYRNTTNGAGASYTALLTRLNVNQVSLSYTVPRDGTYYVVVDNTGSIPGGVDGNQDIRVNYSGSFNYA